jgi:pectate lyase
MPVVRGHTYRMRLESIGTLHRIFVDGRLLLDVDITGPTHGRAALVTDRAQAEFDNVIVSPTLFTTLYSNDFEDGTGPWNFSGLGFWNLRTLGSAVFSQSSVAGDARASIGVPTDDQIVRVRARLDTFATPTGTQERWFGLMARHVDDANFYYLSLRSSNTVQLRKVVNGTITPLASATLPVLPAHWYQLRLDAVGDQLRAYVDGNLMLEADDTSLPVGDSGPVMFKSATDFDDFAAYQP